MLSLDWLRHAALDVEQKQHSQLLIVHERYGENSVYSFSVNFVAFGFQVSICISVLVRIRSTKEEFPNVSETPGNKDSCITISVSIRDVVESILEISMPLCPRRLSLMLTQYLKI